MSSAGTILSIGTTRRYPPSPTRSGSTVRPTPALPSRLIALACSLHSPSPPTPQLSAGTHRPTFDMVVSISNFEHDGLGRYGDPIDPDGDLRAMNEMRSLVSPGGVLILGVPVARDAVVWNAHRLYGRVRLPLLLRGWSVEAFVGFDGQVRLWRHG
jgi:hypothetical protein